MGDMVRSIGIIGLSEGNGHPFSYSAIINGYSHEGLAASGWPGIFHYVRRRHPSEFGLHGWTVTHAWTQDQELTKKLCNACKIPHPARHYLDFLGHVDAVIVARDDDEVHREIAQPFLEAGIPVFIDKPLSLRVEDLRFFKPYLESGQLMSCSGMRYARELDEPRANLADFGELKLIQGSIVLSWEKYGVHLLEAAFSMINAKPFAVWAEETNHFSARIRLENGLVIRINALGDVSRTFRLDFFGSKSNGTFEILDNFSMFRRMLWSFTHSIEVHQPAIPPESTLQIMQVLIAGQRSKNEGREVLLDEIGL
jgi:hypothetical protein